MTLSKDLDLLNKDFRSVLDQFSLVENPDKSDLLILSHFLQYCFKNNPIYQTLQSNSKCKAILFNCLSSLIPFHEGFDFQYSRNIPPNTSISHFTDFIDLTL